MAKENREKKEQEERLMREAEGERTSVWTFKGVNRVANTQPIPQRTEAPSTAPTGFLKLGGKKAE